MSTHKERVSLLLVAISSALILSQVAYCPTSGEVPQVEVFFSPQDNCASEIVSRIDDAKSSIHIAMYFFTSRPIAQALVGAKGRGVDVKVCLDKEQPTYEYSKSEYLRNKEINTRLVGGSGIMHHKFCVIDDHIVMTGSYNWTARADLENDENLLIINSREIAKKYSEEFEQLWKGSKIDTYKYKDETRTEKVPTQDVIKSLTTGEIESIYIGHKGTKKFHRPNCQYGKKISEKNRVILNSREEAIDQGYTPCKVCKP